MKKIKKETENLVLRALERRDFLAWKFAYTHMSKPKNKWDKVNKKPEDLTYLVYCKILQSQRMQRAADRFYDLAVFHKKTGELIGSASIMGVSRGLSQSAFIGYSVFNLYWGQGFGKEAVGALIDLGFTHFRLHRLEAGIEPDNKRSIRLAKSLKLRKEGRKKRAVYLRGDWRDLLVFAITCEDKKISWKGNAMPRLG